MYKYSEEEKIKYCRGFKKCTLPLTDYAAKMKIPAEELKQWLKEYKEPPAFGVINLLDKIRMYEKSKITMYKHTFFFVYFLWRYTKMEKLIAQLRILKEMNLKPNYSALARQL